MDIPKIENCQPERWSNCDLLTYAVCLAIGVTQFVFYERCKDFVSDAAYYELARSLVENGRYGINTRAETMLPPGCAAMIAVVWVCLGSSHAILIRTMAVFATLFLIASYELLRRQVGRGPAAAITLIIGSSPFLFHFSTHLLYADIPYSFTTTLALLVACQLGTSTTRRSRNALWLSFAALLACSLMLRSAAMSMLAALAAWLITSVINNPSNLTVRLVKLRTFLPLLAIGIAIQGLWMTWARSHEQVQQSSLEKFPGSYVSQLFLKQGNDPELGQASLSDIPLRVGENSVVGSASLLEILLHRWIEPAWNSPLILGTILLVFLGLRSSNWVDSSGLMQWYFAFYLIMYLLWPWDFDARFVLPVAPLASMYLWRGCLYLAGKLGIVADCLKRRRMQLVFLFLSTAMFLYSGLLLARHRQGKLPTVFWLLLLACAVCVPWIKGRLFGMVPRRSWWNDCRTVIASMVLCFVALGLLAQIRMGIKNLEFDLTKQLNYPDIEAAQWIKSNTNADAVVMARHEYLVQHYCGRRVMLLPPSRDPEFLMNIIRRDGIEWIIVADVERWYLPQDNDCFSPLPRTYPDAFHLVHEGPRNRVFQVTPTPRVSTRRPDASHYLNLASHRQM